MMETGAVSVGGLTEKMFVFKGRKVRKITPYPPPPICQYLRHAKQCIHVPGLLSYFIANFIFDSGGR